MNWKSEWKPLALIVGAFLACFYLPVGWERFDHAVMEALHLVKWYAREHVLLCLIPAFFIAGAISIFVSQGSVMKYLGPKANKWLAYAVASVSGTVLAVCSCTVLPLFGGIYRMGAGIGPASAFLYSGPAINVLAIAMTARLLGFEMGIARTIGAVGFSIVIGLAMQFIFRKEEQQKAASLLAMPKEEPARPLWKNASFFAALVAILVFANWGKPEGPGATESFFASVHAAKWWIVGAAALALGIMLNRWFSIAKSPLLLTGAAVAAFAWAFPGNPLAAFGAGTISLAVFTSTRTDESGDWFAASWGFARQILPLLLFGVVVSGFLLGRVGEEGFVPSSWVSESVGGNSLTANLFASFAGALMYFATLTEIPILQGLIGNGMGKGPALALLLAGPALSLPSMIVLRSIMGTKKTLVFVALVVVMATFSGYLYGTLF